MTQIGATVPGRSRPGTPSVAIIGRPNVGKSTLFNKLLGEERAIVHDMPGTTRDAIDTVVETPDGPVRFIDTAGLRRPSKTDACIAAWMLAIVASSIRKP